DEAEDLFDVYLPLVRHEQQPGFGLAVRKEILRRRGAIRSAAVRAPGPKLDALDLAELDRLLSRLETRLRESINGRRLAVAYSRFRLNSLITRVPEIVASFAGG